ncbi:MAG: hypothetical protein KUG77_06675 [Nannocystaceae bacterium]|nr:hypothetical protein [Nannocystaceae bacterium]
MNRLSARFLAKRLPLAIVPALLLVGASASAASLSTTSGAMSGKTKISNGFLFDMTINGVISTQAGNKLSQMVLDCEVDTTDEMLDCEGTLTVSGHGSSDIYLGFDSSDGKARWAIDLNASNALRAAHDLWGEEVMPVVVGNTPEWKHVDWFDGSKWRVFYYSSKWAETFQSITGLPYSTVTDIWTA